MSEVLYRKYRSKSFAEIIGQETVVSILKESIIKDRLSHAYLFCGPRGTGKTSIARIFSRGINCLNFQKNGDVCNECVNCISILNEGNMDIIEMDAASNRGIEEIRNLKDSIDYLPTTLNKKVYIIDEAHMLTKEAFNALLKTLEEPPKHVLFILATTESHKLPITILSRVERYDFRLATKDELIKKLSLIIQKEDKVIKDNSVWDVIFTKSGGSFRDAESLLGKIISNSNTKEVTKEYILSILGIYSEDDIASLVQAIENKEINSFTKHLDSINNLNGNISTLIDQVLEYLHNQILAKSKKGENYAQYIDIVNLFIKTKKDIRDFSDKKMILELNLINFFKKDDIQIKEVKRVINNQKEVDNNDLKAEKPLTKVVLEENKSNMNILQFIGNHPNITLPRLKAILLNSKFEIEKNTLKIFNNYKFNIKFLEKAENLKLILSIASTFDSKISNVTILQNKIEEKDEIEEMQTIIEAPKTEKKEGSNVDNSDIIENIL